MGKNGAKKSQKVAQKFYCEKCDYISVRKNDYEKHLQTKKHAQSQWGKMGQKVAKSRTFFCDCGKSYIYQKGLGFMIKNQSDMNNFLKLYKTKDKINKLSKEIKNYILTNKNISAKVLQIIEN